MDNDDIKESIIQTNNMYRRMVIETIDHVIDSLNEKQIPVDDKDAFAVFNGIPEIVMTAFKNSISDVYNGIKYQEKENMKKELKILIGGKEKDNVDNI